jgi:S-adenosylmethionine/arginine decarboxylase-like enzyme
MNIFGQELWADLAVPARTLGDPAAIRQSLRLGAAALGCAVLSEHHQLFEPSGVTAVVVIGESHLLASSYEELGILAVNVQTCSGAMDLTRGLAAICRALAVEEVRSMVLMRRLDSPLRVVLQADRVPVRDGELCFEPTVDAGYGLSTSSAIR